MALQCLSLEKHAQKGEATHRSERPPIVLHIHQSPQDGSEYFERATRASRRALDVNFLDVAERHPERLSVDVLGRAVGNPPGGGAHDVFFDVD